MKYLFSLSHLLSLYQHQISKIHKISLTNRRVLHLCYKKKTNYCKQKQFDEVYLKSVNLFLLASNLSTDHTHQIKLKSIHIFMINSLSLVRSPHITSYTRCLLNRQFGVISLSETRTKGTPASRKSKKTNEQ